MQHRDEPQGGNDIRTTLAFDAAVERLGPFKADLSDPPAPSVPKPERHLKQIAWRGGRIGGLDPNRTGAALDVSNVGGR